MPTKKRSQRPSKYKAKPPRHLQDALKLNLNHIVRELEAAKVNNDGKIPYGAITSMVRKMTHLLPWLTKDMIQHQLRKRNGMMNDLVDGDDDYNNGGSGQHGTSLPGSSMSNTDGGTLSTLTHDTAADNTEDNMTEPPQAQNYKPLDHHITTTLPLGLVHHHARDNEEEEENSEFMLVEGEKTTAGEKNSNDAASTPTCRDLVGRVMVVERSHTNEESTSNSFGRPRGTTMMYSRDLKEQVRLATKEAATKYRDVREKAKLANSRAKRGSLADIVAAAKHKYGIIDANICIHTVRTRASSKTS